VRKGEVISRRLAAVLSKLGIKAVEAGLSMKAIYDNGLIITGEDLELDIEEKAYLEAYSLMINAAIVTPESIADLIRKAEMEASALKAKLEL